MAQQNWNSVGVNFSGSNQAMANASRNFSQVGTIANQIQDRISKEAIQAEAIKFRNAQAAQAQDNFQQQFDQTAVNREQDLLLKSALMGQKADAATQAHEDQTNRFEQTAEFNTQKLGLMQSKLDAANVGTMYDTKGNMHRVNLTDPTQTNGLFPTYQASVDDNGRQVVKQIGNLDKTITTQVPQGADNNPILQGFYKAATNGGYDHLSTTDGGGQAIANLYDKAIAHNNDLVDKVIPNPDYNDQLKNILANGNLTLPQAKALQAQMINGNKPAVLTGADKTVSDVGLTPGTTEADKYLKGLRKKKTHVTSRKYYNTGNKTTLDYLKSSLKDSFQGDDPEESAKKLAEAIPDLEKVIKKYQKDDHSTYKQARLKLTQELQSKVSKESKTYWPNIFDQDIETVMQRITGKNY